MKIALIVLIILNLRFLIKGYIYKISFTGALYMLATQNPFITDDEIQALGKKSTRLRHRAHSRGFGKKI